MKLYTVVYVSTNQQTGHAETFRSKPRAPAYMFMGRDSHVHTRM